MKTKSMALVACAVLVAVLMIANAGGVSVAMPGEPIITVIMPKMTLIPIPLDMTVNIPDPDLKIALHNATGIPQGESIHVSDLAALAGTLNLSGKGIADAEGLQYCTNVAKLNLTLNELSSLPPTFKKLTKLTELNMSQNEFESFPAVLTEMPGLKIINLSTNLIKALPDNIGSITNLETFTIQGNKLTALPASLGALVKLKSLDASYNEIKSVPKELFAAPSLKQLYLASNFIEQLPDKVKDAPELQWLILEYNKLTALPEGIGNAPKLYLLDAGFNNLTRIEPSLCGGTVTHLSVQGNRIKQLPDEMQGKAFVALVVEWNFLDLAQGTHDRAIIDSVNVNTVNLKFERQLSPVALVSTSATESAVYLQWKPLSDGSSGGDSWKVLDFKVYDSGPSPDKLLDTLDETATECTLSGLNAGQEYSLYVKVFYELTVAGKKTTTSCSTSTKVTTNAAPATAAPSAAEATATATPAADVTPATEATPTAEATPSPEATPTTEATPSPEATQSPDAAAAGAVSGKPGDQSGGSSSGLILALIIIGSLIALALIALVVVLIVRKPGGDKTKIRYRM